MKPKSAAVNLLDELQNTLAHGTVARRVETLRRVTDLFLNHAVDYSPEQIAVFDDIFSCLLEHMEASAKALLAQRLAPSAMAPPRAIRALAFDDAIDVAAPVLSQSERLDENALVENARTKSQRHLLAISVRKTLSGAVTDVLVERGNEDVVKSTVGNPGAKFSEHGYTTLLTRAEGDDAIATCVGLRPEIPRHHYLKLIARASAAVRTRLKGAHPQWSDDVTLAVQEAARRARSAPAPMRQAAIAHGLVRSLYEDGRIDEMQVTAFAEADKFDEANAAIACLASVPVTVAETMMIESRNEGIFILSKVAGFSWPTVRIVIQMRQRLAGTEAVDDDEDRQIYERLRLSTAQQVLRFHRMQEASAITPR